MKQENEMSSYDEEILNMDEMEEVEVVDRMENEYAPQTDYYMGYVHKNRLPGAIVSAALIAGPLGIAGIVYAVKSNRAYRQGNIADARFMSRKAKKWIRFGLWLGVAVYVIFVVLYVAFLVAMFVDAGLY